MLEFGKRIAYHRKRLNMTQTELGEKLNVTAQAVSKWENGISDPDLITINRLSKIFGVTTDDLIGGDETEDETAPMQPQEAESDHAPFQTQEAESEIVAAQVQESSARSADDAVRVQAVPAPTISPAPQVASAPPRIIVAYCDDCKRPIRQGERYHVKTYRTGQRITCPECQHKNEIRNKNAELYDEKKALKRGLIWGGSVGGGTALIVLLVAIISGNYAWLAALLISVWLFVFISQCFWGEWMSEFMGFFLRSFRMPGVIFTLDIDGIIWAISVKILLGVLSVCLSALVALIGVGLSLLVSIVTFPVGLICKLHKIKKMNLELNQMEKKK